MNSGATNWYRDITDRYNVVESLFQEISERKTVLMEIDGRLIASSMRLIAESRELLGKLDNLLPR